MLTCKGSCKIQHEVKNVVRGEKNGFKRCSICSLYIKWEVVQPIAKKTLRVCLCRGVAVDAVERGALDAEENHVVKEEKPAAAVEEDKYIINLNLIYIYGY